MKRSTKTLFACAALIGLGVAGSLSMATAAPDSANRPGYSETEKGGKPGKAENRHERRHHGREAGRHHRGKHHGHHGRGHERHGGHGFHHGYGFHGGPGFPGGPGFHGGPAFGPGPFGFVAKLFEEYDADGTGKISIDEVLTVRSDELKKYDKNGDGQLDLQEYEALWLDKHRERMVRSFQRFDRDGDAKVTPQEYNRDIERLARKLDRNKDGVIEKIGRPDRKERGDWRRDGRRQMERAPVEHQAPADDDAADDSAE